MNTPSAATAPTKVAVVGQGLGGLGGVPSVARWLVNQLSLDPAFEVEVIELATSSRDPNSRRLVAPQTWLRRSLRGPDGDGLTTWGANLPEIEAARYMPRRGLTAHLRSADVIQVVAGGPAVGRACLAAGRPVVLQVATLSAWERVALSGLRQKVHALNQPVVAACERQALLGSTAVLVENRQMAQHVRELGQTSVHIAPPGVDCSVFKPDHDGWRRKGPLLSVCRLPDGRKGLIRMVRSYERLVRLWGDSVPELILAGAGPVPGYLTDELMKSDLLQRVRLLTDVDQGDLPSLYRSASCFLQTSYEEGLGLSSVEAMASGVPVVASATAGSREVVDDPITGRLIEEGEDFESRFATAVSSVLESEGQAMSESARARALRHFSNESTYATFRDVYRRAVAASP